MASIYSYNEDKGVVTIKRNKDFVVGTYSVIENELHFLCCFSKEWEALNSEYIGVLTKKQLHKLKSYLGSFEVYAN